MPNSQEYLRAILQNVRAGVCILEGPDFRFSEINEVLAEINGIPVDDHLGRPLVEVIPDAALAILPRLQNVLETGASPGDYEFSMHLGGTLRHFVDRFFPVRVGDQVWAVGAIVEEITPLREVERRLTIAEARRLVERLTRREYEVFVLVAASKSNREIAELLGITVRTVKAHCAEVMRKMEANSRVVLGRLAERLGDIKPYR